MFYISTAIVGTQAYAFIKIHLNVPLKYVYFNLRKLYFNKVYFKRKNMQHYV